MNRNIKRFVAFAAALIGTASTIAIATNCQAEEFVVSSRIIGDSIVGPSGSEFVGDMSAEDAGIIDLGMVDTEPGSGAIGRSYGQPDLFYNYYTKGNSNTSNAQMYLSPMPVPPNVGHTFYTYQPFYPEELLYHHKNRYHKYYDNGRGMNRTKVRYSSPPIRQAASNIYWNYLRIPR